jgi:hypothetical protein
MKAQAALEFLMTYGWAILIVIAVVAALYAMGIFRLPGGGATGPCSPCFPPGSDIAYIAHNTTHVLLRVGPNAIRYGGNQYNTSDVFAYPHGCGTWPCSLTVNYNLVVDNQEMPKTATATLHSP